MYKIVINGINPRMYSIRADNHEFIPDDSFKIVRLIPRNMVTTSMMINDASSK